MRRRDELWGEFLLLMLLLFAVAAALILSGCGMPYECVTRGGLRVANDATCDDGLDAIQARIEYEASLLGFKPHVLEHARLFEISQNLDAKGAWRDDRSGMVRGLADCSMATLSVARWNDEAWTTTALAHEAFHLAQGCVYDTSVLDSCRAAGGTVGEDGPAIEFRCTQEAQHPGWAASVYPAIARIDAGGAL